jgi:hypothetical protein
MLLHLVENLGCRVDVFAAAGNDEIFVSGGDLHFQLFTEEL